MKQNQKLQFILDRFDLSIDKIESRPFFSDQIFMGAGHPTDFKRDFTGQKVALLHHLVDEACYIIGGMQQNGGMGYEFNQQERIDSQKRLEAIVENIKIALLGKQ